MDKKFICLTICIVLSLLLTSCNEQNNSTISTFTSDTGSTQYINDFVNKNRNDLWKLNKNYSKTHELSLFNEISNEYENLWAPDKKIANFYSMWISKTKENNPKNYHNLVPFDIAFIWFLRTDNYSKIRVLPKLDTPLLEGAKQEYIKDKKSFKKWVLNNVNLKKYSCNYKDALLSVSLLEAAGSINRNYAMCIAANTYLCQYIDKNTPYNLYPMSSKFLPISNIAKYSYIMNKVSQKARDIIVDYYNLYAKHKGALKDLSKSIRGKCIVDVVKKYDLLHGKPKDGYYYPVNDMKIKVESD